MSPPHNRETPGVYFLLMCPSESGLFPALLWESEGLGLKGLHTLCFVAPGNLKQIQVQPDA